MLIRVVQSLVLKKRKGSSHDATHTLVVIREESGVQENAGWIGEKRGKSARNFVTSVGMANSYHMLVFGRDKY